MNLDNTQNFLFYTGSDGKDSIQVYVDKDSETVWMTQKGMSEVFGVGIPAISKHLSNVFDEGELLEDSVVSKMETTANDGKNYMTSFYNLDAIISVGYRVNSRNATRFRIWATSILKEYLVKGFVLDDDRLKQGKTLFGKDYFDDLIERIREIRASERRFYQKITDIYATAVDYNPKSPTTQKFYATAQNKLEFAITKQTASEIVYTRADHAKPNMGLTSWKGQKTNGKVVRTDVGVAKNYLNMDEISELNTVVNMYLDYAELQAKKNNLMTMNDWVEKLDAFLQFNDYEVLQNAGTISSLVAKSFAEKQFDKFRVIQDREYSSDFDNVVKGITTAGNLPIERIDTTKLSTNNLSLKKELANEKKKPDKSKLSDFNKNLNKALNFNPKEKGDQ